MRRIRTVNAARRRKAARENHPHRHLRPETLKRIARGISRFIIGGRTPFLTETTSGR